MKNLYRTIAACTLGLAIAIPEARARVVVERNFFPDPVEYNFPGNRGLTTEKQPLSSRYRDSFYEEVTNLLRDLERKGSNLTLYWQLLKLERGACEELSDIGIDSIPFGAIKA